MPSPPLRAASRRDRPTPGDARSGCLGAAPTAAAGAAAPAPARCRGGRDRRRSPAGRPARPGRDQRRRVRGEEGGAARPAVSREPAPAGYDTRVPQLEPIEVAARSRCQPEALIQPRSSSRSSCSWRSRSTSSPTPASPTGWATRRPRCRPADAQPDRPFRPVRRAAPGDHRAVGRRAPLRLGEADAGQPERTCATGATARSIVALAGPASNLVMAVARGDRLAGPRRGRRDRPVHADVGGPTSPRERALHVRRDQHRAGGLQPDPDPAARRLGDPVPLPAARRRPGRSGRCSPSTAAILLLVVVLPDRLHAPRQGISRRSMISPTFSWAS